ELLGVEAHAVAHVHAHVLAELLHGVAGPEVELDVDHRAVQPLALGVGELRRALLERARDRLPLPGRQLLQELDLGELLARGHVGHLDEELEVVPGVGHRRPQPFSATYSAIDLTVWSRSTRSTSSIRTP